MSRYQLITNEEIAAYEAAIERSGFRIDDSTCRRTSSIPARPRWKPRWARSACIAAPRKPWRSIGWDRDSRGPAILRTTSNKESSATSSSLFVALAGEVSFAPRSIAAKPSHDPGARLRPPDRRRQHVPQVGLVPPDARRDRAREPGRVRPRAARGDHGAPGPVREASDAFGHRDQQRRRHARACDYDPLARSVA